MAKALAVLAKGAGPCLSTARAKARGARRHLSGPHAECRPEPYLFVSRSRRCARTRPDSCCFVLSARQRTLWEMPTGELPAPLALCGRGAHHNSSLASLDWAARGHCSRLIVGRRHPIRAVSVAFDAHSLGQPCLCASLPASGGAASAGSRRMLKGRLAQSALRASRPPISQDGMLRGPPRRPRLESI